MECTNRFISGNESDWKVLAEFSVSMKVISKSRLKKAHHIWLPRSWCADVYRFLATPFFRSRQQLLTSSMLTEFHSPWCSNSFPWKISLRGAMMSLQILTNATLIYHLSPKCIYIIDFLSVRFLHSKYASNNSECGARLHVSHAANPIKML